MLKQINKFQFNVQIDVLITKLVFSGTVYFAPSSTAQGRDQLFHGSVVFIEVQVVIVVVV